MSYTSSRDDAAKSNEGVTSKTLSQPRPQSSNEVDLDIAKMVQQKTVEGVSPRKGASEEPIVLHIWDFAGQDLYYTTHQVM